MSADEGRLQQISAALDGEGPMPDTLDDTEAAFLEQARRLRSLARIEEAGSPPDVSDQVLVQVDGARRRRSRPTVLAAAAVFLAAALAAAVAFRPGGPAAPDPVLADVGDEVVAAQATVEQLDARVMLVERGAHPDRNIRRYRGTLRYRAPETLWLSLRETGGPRGVWPANDVEVVVDAGTAWSTGVADCPVGRQPRCLGATRTVVERGLPPFARDFVAPLELVVPVSAFLPDVATPADDGGGSVVVDTTVARVTHLVEGLRAAGAIRSVHSTDRARLELDAETYTLRRLTVTASATDARQLFAVTNGYDDEAGDVLLDLVVEEADLPDAVFPEPPDGDVDHAGFVAGEVDVPAPRWLPDGFSAHRSGIQGGPGPETAIRSWSDGRAWIRLDVTREWDRDELFGRLGPLVRPLEVGEGTGYTNPSGTAVAIHTDELDLEVSGSVALATLVEVAGSIDVVGERVPDDWPQGDVVDEIPDGALAPPGPVTARFDGDLLLVAVGGPGSSDAVLSQRPGTALGIPPKSDVIEVEVRGVAGRYAPRLGTLGWVERGWVLELRSDGLDLEGLLAVAEGLERR